MPAPLTDSEIFDVLGVPDVERPELARELHARARSVLYGPNAYAVLATLLWQLRRRALEADPTAATGDPIQDTEPCSREEAIAAMKADNMKTDNAAASGDPTTCPSCGGEPIGFCGDYRHR